MQVKQPITYEQQVDALKQKGLVITDDRRCVEFLKQVNYYRFSAYLYPFRTGENRHIPNISFEQVQKVYEFDRKIRSLLLSVMEEIELFLRSRISYYHAHTYGPLGYLEASNYNKGHRHKQFLRLVDNVIDDNKEDNIVRHHMKKYEGKFPIWVVVEFFSIGMLSYFYIDLPMKDKKALAQQIYRTNPSYLDNWLLCLTELRNRCAHYSRLYDWDFSPLPILPANMDYTLSSKLFDQMIVLKLLYFEPADWDEKILPQITQLVDAYEPFIDLRHIGFPMDWQEYLNAYDNITYQYNAPAAKET